MRISRSAIKCDAKSLIDQTTPSPILVALVFMLVMWVLQLLNYTVTGYSQYISQITAQLMQISDTPRATIDALYSLPIVPFTPTFDLAASVLCLAILLMSFMINTGFTVYCLNVANRKKSGFGNLLDGFTIFLKVFWLYIVMSVFVFLWSLLLIVPGVIASYRYRQAVYILLEDNKLGALECINRSKAMMEGHKGELFVLDLSFIGWRLLTLIPFVSVFVSPYRYITYSNYYRALRDLPAYLAGGGDQSAPPPPQQ